MRVHPKADQGWHILAMARMAQGRYEAALDPLQRAVQIKPERGELHFKLGHGYEKLRRLDESARAYQAALKLKPDFPEAQNGLLRSGTRVDAHRRRSRFSAAPLRWETISQNCMPTMGMA